MSKSIYEEAKRDLISLTAKFVIPHVEETEYGCIYDSCHFYNTLDEDEERYLKNVEQALEKAKRQEKLLYLYKELSKYVDDETSAHELPEIIRLKTLIQELEKELDDEEVEEE